MLEAGIPPFVKKCANFEGIPGSLQLLAGHRRQNLASLNKCCYIILFAPHVLTGSIHVTQPNSALFLYQQGVNMKQGQGQTERK